MDQERERRLADALADLLDAGAGQVSSRRLDPNTPGLPELLKVRAWYYAQSCQELRRRKPLQLP
jgi:hypothetical protein